MRMGQFPVSVLMVAVLVTGGLAGAGEINTGTLLDELVGLDRLSVLPDPAYRVVQFSSYDRRSKIYGGRDWFANSDGFGREPVPGVAEVLEQPGEDKVGRFLLADVEGPGAIVRCWTARMNGTISVFLDGASKPLFEGPANDFLRRLYPALLKSKDDGDYENSLTQRDAGYYPVPFQKRCRIEWRGRLDQLHFYHIEFRRYAPGADVRPFQLGDLKEYAKQLMHAQQALRDPSAHFAKARGEAFAIDKALAPDQPTEVLEIKERAGQVTQVRLRLHAANPRVALRQTSLRIFFDQHSRPQIDAPLGDFFGAAPGVNPFDAVPMTVAPDGTMTCRFVMPFAERVHVWAHNYSTEPVRLEGELRVADAAWDAKRSMHFFARWRVNHAMQIQGRRAFDLPYAIVNGQGRFVGCAALLMNPATVPHPGGSWWGEGDEKIFVDDDAFPSFFGTGSEDYFNYSWSSPDLFAHAYFAQPRNDGPGNCGFVTNNRWHILDDIPFRSRFAFYMEMYHHSTVENLSYARMAYYYARPGAYDDHVPFFRDELRALEMPRGWLPTADGAARNALFTQFEEMEGAAGLTVEGAQWSAGKLVVWSPAGEGNALRLKFQVAKAGKYGVNLVLALTPGSGRFAASIDGKPLKNGEGEEWVADLYTPHQTMLRSVNPGPPVQLEAGEHVLTLVARGKHPTSAGAQIGGDFIWIQPR